MVGVVQLVEHLFVAQVVAGSSPVAYPIDDKLTAQREALVAQLDRAPDFGSGG